MRCDCHVHVVGAPDRYPQVPTRTFLAGVAPLEDLEKRGATRGVSRFILVQPSFYGTDNTLLLESLERLGDRGRGVAVIDPGSAPESRLAALRERGVRGLRVNLYSPVATRAAAPLEIAFAAVAGIARHMRWHVQVIAPLETLLVHAAMLERAPVAVVIDHYGLYGDARPDSAAGLRFLELLRHPHVWLKLSAPYRLHGDLLQTRPDPRWLAALLGVAAERCVWGSDWPHSAPHAQAHGPDVLLPYRPLSYDRLLDDFIAALPAPEQAEAILVHNPARLYGFA